MNLHSEPLTHVIDGRADPQARAIFIGPTACDFSMLSASALIPSSEQKQLSLWRANDLAQHYREIRRRDFR